MSALMYVVVTAGLIAGAVVLMLAVRQGRVAPARKAPWIVALVILGIDTALHVAASVGVLVAGGFEGAWFVLGTLAFVAILAAAVLRPRWAGWALVASAVVAPLLLAVGGLVGPADAEQALPGAVAAVTYSVPAAISGGLLVLSSRAVRRSDSASTSGDRTPALR